MRGDIVKLLLSDAERKPEIADLISQIGNLTEHEIMTKLEVPLPWYRTALIRLKHKQANEAAGQTPLSAIGLNLDGYVVYGFVPDPTGTVRERLDSGFVNFGARGGMMDIPYDALLWFPETGGVWWENSFSPKIDPRLITGSRQLAPLCKTRYLEFCRQRRMQRNPGIQDTTLVEPNSAPSDLAVQGVRFFR